MCHPSIGVIRLTQLEADAVMKGLRGEALDNFRNAFHSEKNKSCIPDAIWALPPEERTYFVVTVSDIYYLLAGLTFHHNSDLVSFSSFAKITEKLHGYGRECLKTLFESTVIPECRRQEKRIVTGRITSTKGYKAARHLYDRGVQGGIVTLYHASPDYTLQVEIRGISAYE